MGKKIIALACMLLAIAVILGALGAHALKKELGPEQLDSFKTGVTYHFYHGLAIILIGMAMEVYKKPGLKWAVYLFLTGIIFFSGSIYLLSTQTITGLSLSFLGPVTPLGGLIFITGWIIACVQFLRK